MTAYTESEKFLKDRRAAVDRYNREKMDTITVRVPKGKKQEYYDAAQKAGLPFRQFMMQALDEKVRKIENE